MAQRFREFSADLTAASESVRLIDEIVEWNSGNPPDIVWCCAGSSTPGLFVDTSIAQLQSQMDSNYFTGLYMAHAAMTCWVKSAKENKVKEESSGGGRTKPSAPIEPRHLIFTASFVSFFTFTGYSAYAPAKAALRSLCDTLSQEANLYAAAYPSEPEIRLHTIFPATILSEALELENSVKPDITAKLEDGDDGQTPEVVAAKAIEGLEAGLQLVSTDILTALVQRSMLGGSLRCGFWRTLSDWFLAWLMGIVIVFVRRDMDNTVRNWGKLHGTVARRGDTSKQA